MKRIVSDKAPAALGPYVQAVDTGSTVYCSGQLGLDPATGVLPEGVVAQTHQSLKNLQAVLVNEIYAQYFHEYPARSCVQIAALPKNALVEIECIAARG